MLQQNPTSLHRDHVSPFCAIRRRKADGSQNVGKPWIEPMGSVAKFVENQKEWEVVYYATGDVLPE